MMSLPGVVDQLFELVIDLDPARSSVERIGEELRGRCRALSREIDAHLQEVRWPNMEAQAERAVREALASASANLRAFSDAVSGSRAEQCRQVYAGLAKSYDQLTRTLTAARLSGAGAFRRLTPANRWRNLFHVSGGVTGALCYHFLLDHTAAIVVMAIFVVTFTALEIARRRSGAVNDALMRFPAIRRIARAREYYQVNSGTYYAYGMLIAVLACPQLAVESACLVLAFGDPVAANVGRRFGKVKLFRDKSVAGTAGFAIAAFLVLLVYQLALYSAQPLPVTLRVAAAGAVAGALAEAFTVRLDDNFTVPLAAALAITLVV